MDSGIVPSFSDPNQEKICDLLPDLKGNRSLINIMGSKLTMTKISELAPWWSLAGGTVYFLLTDTDEIKHEILPVIAYGAAYAITEKNAQKLKNGIQIRLFNRGTILAACAALQMTPNVPLQSATMGIITAIALHEAQHQGERTLRVTKTYFQGENNRIKPPYSDQERLETLQQALESNLNVYALIIKPSAYAAAVILGGGALIAGSTTGALALAISEFTPKLIASSLIYEQAYRATKNTYSQIFGS
jgi:hypothetical protein